MGLFDKFKKSKDVSSKISIDIDVQEQEMSLDRYSSMATYPKKFESKLSKDLITDKISKSDEVELIKISEYIE